MSGSVDWNAIMAVATAVSVVISIISGVYTWISSRDKVTEAKFAEMRQDFESERRDFDRRLHALDRDLVELKGRVNALPDEARIDGISRGVDRVDGGLKALQAEVRGWAEVLKGVRDSAKSIDNYLRHRDED